MTTNTSTIYLYPAVNRRSLARHADSRARRDVGGISEIRRTYLLLRTTGMSPQQTRCAIWFMLRLVYEGRVSAGPLILGRES